MIIYLIGNVLVGFLNLTLGSLPHISTFPFVDSYLVTGMSYFRFMVVLVPPLGIMFAGFMWIMSFKIGVLTLRLLRIIR